MSGSSNQYSITIHGTAHGFAIGDQASVVMGTEGARATSPFMTPPLPPQGIFGRDAMLTEIFDALALNDEQATNIPPLALRGMGGIGKTTLAKALGRLEFIPKFFPGGVLWTELGPNPTIRILLDGWGKALGVDLLPERDENACRDRLRGILYHRKVLLIVDDVWQTAHGNYFLVAGPQCRTLFTTREVPVAQDLATRKRTLPVDVLSPGASLALLHQLASEAVVVDEQSAKRLCERLEFLPLALTLAGRLLANEADIPTRMQRLVSELIERRQARLQLLQAEGRKGLDEDHPVSIEAILGMSVERLDRTDQERFAMLSVFGGEPLTWEINATAAVWECSVEETEATISRFIQRGLVERRGERYWMHALLSDYAAEMMDRMGL
jgi:NB-ARC domain